MIEGVYMTQKELIRVEIVIKVCQKKLTQERAANELGLSLRQVQRLCQLYNRDESIALASQISNAKSDHCHSQKEENYATHFTHNRS